MDIIDLLTEDHVRLRKELVKIKQDLSQPNLREEIKSFISSYEMHESLEEEVLLPSVSSLLEKAASGTFLVAYEQEHTRMWGLLENLMDSLSSNRISDRQQAYFNFAATSEAHFGYEERVLFPIIREVVDQSCLEDLGHRADERLTRFAFH